MASVRQCANIPPLPGHTVRRNFQNWIMKRHSGKGEKFNEEQVAWLRMIRDHIVSSMHIERDDLELARLTVKAGWGKCISSSGRRLTT